MKIEPGGSGTFCTVFVFACWCRRESRQVIFGKKSVVFNLCAHEGHDAPIATMCSRMKFQSTCPRGARL